MRKTERPPQAGCEGTDEAPRAGGLFSRHQWVWSSSWNSNNRRVLPFWEESRSIARSGWRCHRCSKTVWDLTDLEFALSVAHAAGMIKLPTGPDFKSRVLEKQGADG